MFTTNAQSSVIGNINPNVDASSYAGFVQTGNPFQYAQQCSGKGTAMNPFGYVVCPKLLIDPSDVDTCNNISGCHYGNSTWYGISAGCQGYVNSTYYNFTAPFDKSSTYCGASGLQADSGTCEVFGCTFQNATSQFDQPRTVNSQYNIASIWQIISWVTTFNFDIGWGSFNWLFSIIAFYLPFLILLMALYFMFVPF